jgi:hypothetical protein
MDRETIYSGQVPRTLDLLMAQQNTMVGIAKLAEAVFGTPTLVDGFTCTPTTPASLNVLLTGGAIYQVENLEATTWSAVAADTSHSIVKQGIMLDAATLGITPPGTVGYSQVYLIEVQYADSDTGSTVLPYYNASNPAAPYSGPGNAGTAQNTVRKGIVAVSRYGRQAAAHSLRRAERRVGLCGRYRHRRRIGRCAIARPVVTDDRNAHQCQKGHQRQRDHDPDDKCQRPWCRNHNGPIGLCTYCWGTGRVVDAAIDL